MGSVRTALRHEDDRVPVPPPPPGPTSEPPPSTVVGKTNRGLRGWATRWRRPLTAFGILLAGVAGLGLLIGTKPDTPRTPKPERVWTVDAVTVDRADHRPSITLNGTLGPGREVDLRSLVAGTVVAISPALKDGGLVRQGETLLTIEGLDYRLAVAQAKASLDEARARLDELRANVQVRQREAVRTEELFRRGAIAAPRFEEAQNAFVAEQARVRAQDATVARLAAALTMAETDLSRTNLVAPFDSFVGLTGAEVGMRLSPADRVARLTAADGLEAVVTLPTAVYGRLVADGEQLIGRDAQVVWNLGERHLRFPAKVVRIADRLETATGGVRVFVRIQENLLDKPLRAGAFVQVELPDRLYPGVVRLPVSALHGDNHVYVVEEGRLKLREVKVVATKVDSVFIGDGLSPGDRVVTTRFQEIGNDLKVTVRGDAKPDPASATAPANRTTTGTKG